MKITQKEKPAAVFGTWEVYPDGTLIGKLKGPGGKEHEVEIYPDRLTEPDLLLAIHADRLSDDWNNIIPAFFEACRLAGVKSLTINTDFE